LGGFVRIVGKAVGLTAALLLAVAAPAAADDWLPHPAGAKWQYTWADSAYNPSGTTENVVVQKQSGQTFTLAWSDPANTPPAADATVISCPASAQAPDIGTMAFHDTNSGLLNADWNSCPPPAAMPILCPTASACANSLSSTLYNLIWGNRVPVLSEPLLQGTTWTATGGVGNDVSSNSRYLGLQPIKVPAFPNGLLAAVVRTNIVQAGALGDPYGSGVRTVWWVYGVGPVRILFQHEGGSYAPVTNAVLQATNLKPLPPRPDVDYFPLRPGLNGRYSWTNSRFLKRAEVEDVTVAAAANRTARLSVKSVSGPLRVIGQYGFTSRLDGLTSVFGSASAATLVKLPKLGHGQRFLTPVDMMVYGFNPLLPAYAVIKSSWHSGNGKDFSTYGVDGKTRILGLQTVRVPAGRFRALEVQSTLTQKGYPYGSGVRTMWFAPGRGLVKLLFRHRDHSISLVQLLK
jgi:hypothetical protein